MPTTRKRHLVTETDPVARALDDAAERWPEIASNRAKLLLRLVQEGHRAVVAQHENDDSSRRDAVARTSGACTGVYSRNYLTELRKDWPE